jgi:hypothetical protein
VFFFSLAEIGIEKSQLDLVFKAYKLLKKTVFNINDDEDRSIEFGECYKYQMLPTGRPVPQPVPRAQESVNTQPQNTGVERWITLKNEDLTPKMAKLEAEKWIDAQNKIVYGVYTFVEMSFKTVNENMIF